MKTFRKITGIERRWIFNNVILVIALVVSFVVIFSVSFSVYCYSNLRVGLREKAKTTTDFFANYISQSYNEYYQSCIRFAQTFEEKNTLELQFISTSGKIVASSYGQWAGEAPKTADVAEAIATREMADFQGRNPSTGERIMAVSSPMLYVNGEVIGVLRYVTSLKNVDRQIAMAVGLAVLVGVLFIAFVLYSSRFFIRSILAPVSEITATAKRIAAGSYGAKIQKHLDDEIGELAETINDMSAKIAQSEKMQAEFISSVSHELRTPLTAITGWGETILSGDHIDPVETRRGMVIILREARRLTSMVEELLEFTRMQDGRFTLNMEDADLRAEFEDTVFMYGSRLQQEGIELEYEESDEEIPEIPCDVSRMRQVFLNILDNAAKHGGEGKKITASIHHESGQVVVRIRDFGPGIPEDELPHVKMKFYKGSSKARGNGIGLAVCEEIVTMHGGSLTLENAPGGGTLVTISLPSGEE
ncbi:MAG TPA: HAMP domain-containing histidine kinase [Candidatus Avoscillospira stercorigallinarum]|uniref:histidine kinase n=1 Tax=Candidatus Avoscillospira stercorigallinarum TaxID=2840708 RepID=A0A9D0Z6Y4_9FIRM|nr:HAMP domain-containing histidine kinase [Candidatus Avoscillospira stercorigallinarum]